MLTVPMDQRLDKLTSVELVVTVGVVHLEVVELQLLLGHVRRVDRNIHVFFHVSRKKNGNFKPNVQARIRCAG
jgi:hypothetical protein